MISLSIRTHSGWNATGCLYLHSCDSGGWWSNEGQRRMPLWVLLWVLLSITFLLHCSAALG